MRSHRELAIAFRAKRTASSMRLGELHGWIGGVVVDGSRTQIFEVEEVLKEVRYSRGSVGLGPPPDVTLC